MMGQSSHTDWRATTNNNVDRRAPCGVGELLAEVTLASVPVRTAPQTVVVVGDAYRRHTLSL